MINNEWLLSGVTFIVSFTLTLLVFRDINTALLAGLFAVPAAFAGLIAVNRKRRIAQKRVLTALQVEIRQMEEWKYQLETDLWAISNQSEQIQQQINSRQTQFNWLQVQIGEKQKLKQQLTLALIALGEDKRHVEEAIYHLNQQKEELDLSVRSLKSQHYKAETYKNELLADLQHLKEEIAFQKTEKQRLQETLDFLRSQMHEWQMEDVEVHDIKPPDEELTSVETQKLLTASSEEKPDADLDAEWAEFVAQLTYPELEVLKAIVEQDNPNSTIKNIAESHITMPELLIDAINERAIATLGDIIIEPGTDAPAIADPEYLQTVKKVLEIKAVK